MKNSFTDRKVGIVLFTSTCRTLGTEREGGPFPLITTEDEDTTPTEHANFMFHTSIHTCHEVVTTFHEKVIE
jgi:hypothetical protein